MTPNPPVPEPRSEPSARGYLLMCLTALMAMILALMENDCDLTAAFLLGAMGALMALAAWRIDPRRARVPSSVPGRFRLYGRMLRVTFGPPLLVLGLVVVELYTLALEPWYGGNRAGGESWFMNAVIAASVLAYSAAYYRLLALVHAVFPVDYRTPPPPPGADGKRGPPPDTRQPRSAHLPGPWEMPFLALTAGVWAVGAALLLLALSAAEPPPHVRHGLWRGLLLIFLVALTAAVLAAAASYLRWVTARPEEHRMFLQDQAWRETRREQNRINRFLTWARLRAQRRKEKA